MPPRKNPLQPRNPASEHDSHPLHRHRPVVTMAIGFVVILAIAATAMATFKEAKPSQKNTGTQKQRVSIDTTDWVPYQDPTTKLAFKHPPDWDITVKAEGAEQLISLISKKEQSKMSVYVSSSGYLGFEGLPQTNTELDGYLGVKVSDGLLGVKKDGQYFTFDAGLDTNQLPVFQEVVKSVKFD